MCPVADLERQVGFIIDDQELALTEAIQAPSTSTFYPRAVEVAAIADELRP